MSLRNAAEVQAYVEWVSRQPISLQLPPSARERRPPPVPKVRVRALKANWRFGGETVEPGEVYTLDAGDAERLIAVGKAEGV